MLTSLPPPWLETRVTRAPTGGLAPSQLFLTEIPPIGFVNAEAAFGTAATGTHHSFLSKMVLQESFQTSTALWPVALPAYRAAAWSRLEMVSFSSGLICCYRYTYAGYLVIENSTMG